MSEMGKDLKQKAVDLLCLGSWHIYSRMSLDENVKFIQGSMERGINHFDIGDYWDHDLLNTQRFKEVADILGLRRESYRLGLKVFTNSTESRELVVKRMLDLLGMEYADYILFSRPNPQETMQEAVEAMNELVEQGLTKELDFSLWDAPLLKQAYDLLQSQNMHLPRFVQFQYNICRRDVVESEAYQALFRDTGMKLQAAFTLEGGILGGHVTRRRFEPEERTQGIWFPAEERNMARDSGGIRREIVRKVPRLIEVAQSVGLSPAQLAMAFPATNPNIENVLFGATKLWQLDEAIGAMEFALTRPDEVRALTQEFYTAGAEAPHLFDFNGGHLH